MRDDHLWAAVKITEAAVTQLFNGASTPNEVRRGQQIGEIVAELYTAIYAGIVEADYRVGKIDVAEFSDQESQSDTFIPVAKPLEPKLPEAQPVEVPERMIPAVAIPSTTAPVESCEVEFAQAEASESPLVEQSFQPVASADAMPKTAPAMKPADVMPKTAPAIEPADVMPKTAPAIEPADAMPKTAPAIEPAEGRERSSPPHLFADLMEKSSPAVAPGNDLKQSFPTVASADAMPKTAPAIEPVGGTERTGPPHLFADLMEKSSPAIVPVNDLDKSAPTVEPEDVEDSEPVQESASPAITMDDVWERIGSPRSGASKFFDR